jgi:hypothetical protein
LYDKRKSEAVMRISLNFGSSLCLLIESDNNTLDLKNQCFP